MHSFTWFEIRSLTDTFHFIYYFVQKIQQNLVTQPHPASSFCLSVAASVSFCLYFTAWYTPLVGLSCSLVVYFLACVLAYYSSRWQFFLYVPVSISLCLLDVVLRLNLSGPWCCFSKAPRTFRARKARCQTRIRLFVKLIFKHWSF